MVLALDGGHVALSGTPPSALSYTIDTISCPLNSLRSKRSGAQVKLGRRPPPELKLDGCFEPDRRATPATIADISRCSPLSRRESVQIYTWEYLLSCPLKVLFSHNKYL